MPGRPDRLAFGGFVVMVILVVAALMLPMDSDRLAAYRAVYGDDPRTAQTPDAPDDAALQSTQSAQSAQRATGDGTSDADIAFILQSIRTSLHRDDLASAKVLLDTVLSVRKNLPEALELRKELDVREARDAKAFASLIGTPAASDGAHDASPGPGPSPVAGKMDRAVEPPAQPAVAGQASNEPRDKPEHRSRRERGASADRTYTRTRHVAQTSRHHPTTHAYYGRPKTRAEVVRELKRARANGTMPRFNRPYPYGTGSTYHAAR